MRLVLPLPPSVNKAYRNVSVDKRIKTKEATEYIHDAGWTAKAWAMRNGWHMPQKDQKVIIRMWIWWPNRTRRDPDNLFKILNDSLKGILVEDDNVILPQVIDFDYDKQNPRLEIELERVAI